MKHLAALSVLILLAAACSLDNEHKLDADKEFSKLETPDVGSVKGSMERGALESLKNGDYARSSSLYQQLYDQDKTELRYQLGLAESYRRLAKYDQAIDYYDLILEKHPGHVDAFEGKALAIMALGDIEESSKMFQKVLEREPERWRTHNALGIMFAVKNMLPEAMAYFNEALKYSSDNPSIHNNVGLLLAMQKQYRQSADALKRASRKSVGLQRKQIDLNLALVHGIFGNINDARSIAERHLKGMALENNLGLYAHLAKDDELAKSYLNMALAGSSVYYERAWRNLDIINNQDDKKVLSPAQRSIRVGTDTTVFPMESQELAPPPVAAPVATPPTP